MALRRITRTIFAWIEGGFDRIFGPAWNPFYQLGALGWFFYWIVTVSGIYLYIFFDTGVTDAYESVDSLTHAQWYAGGVMRSLHRYASDALVVVMMLHLLREFVMDRLRGPRWLTWITGVPIIWFVFICGISGYWLVWDKLAQYVAIATTEWLDALPIFGEPIARNFLNQASLSDRFFTLMVFLHVVVPLFLLLVMWIHIQRIADSKINPPRGLAVGTLATLLVLSFVYPAVSQGGPADLDAVPAVVRLDWYYLSIYPLLDWVSGAVLWASLGLVTLLLLWLPWLPFQRRRDVAVVNLDNCNGCGRCVADCPFTAVSLGPRTDDKPFEQEAVVNAKLCVSCGICAGACPTSTPFRRAKQLVPGIDIPAYSVGKLREETIAVADKLSGDDRVLVYGCRAGVDLSQLQVPNVGVVSLPCIGALPPPFIDFIIMRRYADGVLLTGCPAGDCYHRFGIAWTEQRTAGERDPILRRRVPRERIHLFWAGLAGTKRLVQELAMFRTRLKELGPLEKVEVAVAGNQPKKPQVEPYD